MPKRLKIDANSTPTAPAPMIPSVFGTVVRFRISMLVRMNCGSGCKPGQHARFRAGGDDDVLRLEGLRAAVSALTSTLPPPLASRALDPLDLVLLHQELDALGVLGDDPVLAVVDQRQVEAADSRSGCPAPSECRKYPRHRRYEAAPWSECSRRAGRCRPVSDPSR